ncbi:AAA family ATPase [Micromonospora sp. C31]|uniref:AAA family ATPase n=1 Tax=Micromonospora sp. C31 TaxID=2824876 RepID=UPI001B380574|nr:AAA family ATPase [Micromonospora sp. C31]MBQ1076402.1 AAA family ATPase [Micromonospora sp. C31]
MTDPRTDTHPDADANTTAPQLVVLIGPAGAGKSTWAAAHYQPHQVHSLDQLRAVVSDDECDQDATADALVLLPAILHTRLARRLTTVVDATSTSVADRAWLLGIAAEHQVPAVAVVVTTPLEVCLARQAARPGPAPGRRWGRAVPAAVVATQHADTRAALATLHTEGFTHVTEIGSPLPGASVGTEIHYQTYCAATDTAGTVAHTVDSLDEADRLAANHARSDVDVHVTAVVRPDGRDLVREWEHTHAAVL